MSLFQTPVYIKRITFNMNILCVQRLLGQDSSGKLYEELVWGEKEDIEKYQEKIQNLIPTAFFEEIKGKGKVVLKGKELRMKTICGMDCCSECSQKETCGGCQETGGHPFGGSCAAAECVEKGGPEALSALKKTLIGEFNALGIPYLQMEDLNLLNGCFVNLEYPLANGQKVKLLEDNRVYWGNQIEKPGQERCYGVVADERFLLVCEYGCEGADPQVVLYKRR